MGFTFRKSKKIAPGLKLNFSKDGLGVSAGISGARISLSPKGRVTSTASIPGSGLRYTKGVNLKLKRKSSPGVGLSTTHNDSANLINRTGLVVADYVKEFNSNKTNFFKFGGRLFFILLLLSGVSAAIGQSDFAGGIFAITWFLGVALLFSYIRRVLKSKQ